MGVSGGGGVVTPGPQRFHSVQGDQDSEESPKEETKGYGSLETAADSVCSAVVGTSDKNGERNGASKPEEHGDGLEGKRSETVEDAGIVERGQANIGEDQQGPDGIEKHKGLLAWGLNPRMSEDTDEVSYKPKLDDREDHSHYVDDGDKSVGHLDGRNPRNRVWQVLR